MALRDEIKDVAESIPFDNSSNGFTADNVQAGIEELNTAFVTSASPGFTWGRSGTTNSGTWLQNDTVPSNITGRENFLYNAQIIHVFIANQAVNTFDLQIYEHDGTTYTLLATVPVVAQRKYDAVLSVNITKGKELALYISSGSCKNIVAGLIIKGTFVP